MPLELPDIDPKRELARRLAESLLAKVPFVGDAAVAILSVTHRPAAEHQLGAWRERITGSVNDLEHVIADLLPTIKLSSDAAALGCCVSRTSEQGRTDPVLFQEIQAAFPNATCIELQDACGELEIEGLVTLSAALGHKIRSLRPTTLLFEIFDPIVFEESNPHMDAGMIARFIVEDEVGIDPKVS